MSRMARLLHATRPVLAPRAAHRTELRARLQAQLRARPARPSLPMLWIRRPDLAMLALGAAAAFICWCLSLTLSPGHHSLRAEPVPGADSVSRVEPHPSGRGTGLFVYIRTMLPHPETGELAARRLVMIRQALSRERGTDGF